MLPHSQIMIKTTLFLKYSGSTCVPLCWFCILISKQSWIARRRCSLYILYNSAFGVSHRRHRRCFSLVLWCEGDRLVGHSRSVRSSSRVLPDTAIQHTQQLACFHGSRLYAFQQSIKDGPALQWTHAG